MAELAPNTAPQDWLELADTYARELQIRELGEDDGYSGTHDAYVRQEVFQTPEEAICLYLALAATPHRLGRLAALEGLDKLQAVSPEAADQILSLLTADEDDEVRHCAYHLLTQYG